MTSPINLPTRSRPSTPKTATTNSISNPPSHSTTAPLPLNVVQWESDAVDYEAINAARVVIDATRAQVDAARAAIDAIDAIDRRRVRQGLLPFEVGVRVEGTEGQGRQ